MIALHTQKKATKLSFIIYHGSLSDNSLRHEPDMDFKEYRAHIKRVWTRWAELSGAKTVEKIVDMILMNQMLNTVSKETVIFLKERNTRFKREKYTFTEMGKNYTHAHSGIPFGRHTILQW